MKRMHLSLLLLLLVGVVALAAQTQEKAPAAKVSAVPDTPEWQRLKSLVGHWEGFIEEGSKKMPTTVDVRMTGDGSAIMHTIGLDTPHEMVTMFHPDGKRMLATHYCSAHNQPRMVLVPAKPPNQVVFEYLDGTNIAPGDTHITGVVMTFVDADHHDEAWTSTGASAPTVFKYTRKK
jgi:hypothetical protein